MSNLFMQIDGVKGGVSDKQYKEWISIDHASMGVHSSATIDSSSGQLSSNGVHFEDISFSKEMDAVSTQLVEMVTLGTNIPKVVIALNIKIENKDNEIGRWTYENCIFTRHNINLQNASGIPDEGISMVFGTVKYETSMVDSSGSNSKQGPVGWDQVTNSKL